MNVKDTKFNVGEMIHAIVREECGYQKPTRPSSFIGKNKKCKCKSVDHFYCEYCVDQGYNVLEMPDYDPDSNYNCPVYNYAGLLLISEIKLILNGVNQKESLICYQKINKIIIIISKQKKIPGKTKSEAKHNLFLLLAE